MKLSVITRLTIAAFLAHLGCFLQLSCALTTVERGDIRCVNKATSEYRSNAEFSLTKTTAENATLYHFSGNGRGDWNTFSGVTWRSSAEMQDENGTLRTLQSQRTIFDKNLKIIASYQTQYDYRAKRIYWALYNAQGKLQKKAVYPLKGQTADDITLLYFLKSFASLKNNMKPKRCYLLTNEPRMYQCNVQIEGYEPLDMLPAKTHALKLKLTVNMGILDNLLARMFPKTYFWYASDGIHEWIKYEGLEAGLHSPNIIAFIKKNTSRLPARAP